MLRAKEATHTKRDSTGVSSNLTVRIMRPEEKELVIARLQTMPMNIRVAIGKKSYDGPALIKEVEAESEIGMKIVQVHMEVVREEINGDSFT